MGRRKSDTTAAPALLWETCAIVYVLPSVFLVTGRDATTDAALGALVYIPGSGWSAVQWSVYSGGNTQIHLMDTICYPGMASVGYSTKKFGKTTNLCTAAQALSSGELYEWSIAGNAFDGMSTGAPWISYQPTPNLSGVAWIGQHFATALRISWFSIVQASGYKAGGAISSVKLQYSDNGSSWVDHVTVPLAGEIPQRLYVGPPAAAHAYWRILANSETIASLYWYWGIIELQMGE